MKLLPLIILLSLIASPVLYSSFKTYFYPFQLMRDPKREAIPKAMVQMILDTFKDCKVSELRNIKIIVANNNVKHYFIETFVLDTSTHEKWNNPEAIYLFHIIDNNGHFEYVSHKPRNVWDIGKLIPEDTDNLLQMSPGVPSIVREDLGKKRFPTKEKNYVDINNCETTASSVMCKNTKIKTKDLLNPIFELPSEYRNVRNEWQSDKRNIDSKYNCEFMNPEYSDFRQPYLISPFSCKLRFDLDDNPNRAPVLESTNTISTPLEACNTLSYA